MSGFIHWLENHQLPCSWKATLGISCPGCGMQSAFIELLKGNLVMSLKLFPALIPMIAMILFLGIHLLLKVPKGAMILKFLFIFTSSIMVVDYIVKLM